MIGRVFLLALALMLAACGKKSASVSTETRIVSVGGAVTEIVFALGAGSLVVGVDTSSLFPEEATHRPKVGYQRALAAEGILSLKPTVVVVTPDAGPAAALEQVRNAGITIVVVPAESTVEGVRTKIIAVGEAIGKRAEAEVLAIRAGKEIDDARIAARNGVRPRALFLYARGGGTVMVSGKGTAGSAMLDLSGAENVVTQFDGFRPLTAEAVVSAAPDVIVVPSHGLASLGGIDGVLELPGIALTPAARTRRVVAVDDLLLLGFGPRTGEGVRLLHAELLKT